MLTNIFYYNVYKPYILEKQSKPKHSPGSVLDIYYKRAGTESKAAHVTRNTSLKRAVTSYVDAVCRNITDMRDCSKYLAFNVDNYYSNFVHENFETAKQWVEEDISMFVNAFNSTVAFGTAQEHSPELSRYAYDLADIAEASKTVLDRAGISIHQNGKVLSFSPDKIRHLTESSFSRSIDSASKTAGEVYNRTSELLRLPGSAHMDFRQLSYYYNYRIDRSQEEAIRKTPAILHAGMILDRVI
jgi:hypothetical protein